MIYGTLLIIGFVFIAINRIVPAPEKFNVVADKITIRVGETKEFITGYEPDETFLVIKSSSENNRIARIEGNKTNVVGISEGETKLIWRSKGKIIAEVEVEVIA